MRTEELDYDLPEHLIAQEPIEPRDSSRLLVLHRDTGRIEHRMFRDIGDYMSAGDVLVLNDARVTARRLHGRKPEGAEVEALLLETVGEKKYRALLRPGRRLKVAARIEFQDGLQAVVEAVDPEDGSRTLSFNREPPHDIGSVPLPPYIRKNLEREERYQTVYSASGGSAAAPTAGLHFTPDLLSQLVVRGVKLVKVTLDVGLDTFRPIESSNLEGHKIHGERCTVSAETAADINARNGRVIAVGTTSVRTLESAADDSGTVNPGICESRLFITPGYSFKLVDGMITNFHMPRTTMLSMLAAFAGAEIVMDAYREAVREEYRFLSFGDAMLIL